MDQDAIGWFYIAAFVFVVLPYLVMKIKALSHRLRRGDAPRQSPEEPSRS